MTDPVDLTNLRIMIDHDAALEKELFAEFHQSVEEILHTLSQSITTDDHEGWRKSAHALKGIALNLGAQHLGTLAKEAQEISTVDQQIRKALLAELNREYALINHFLKEN